MATSLLRGLNAHPHFAETEALQPWQGSSALFLEEIRVCPSWFHPIAFTSCSLALGNQRRVVRWPLLELAAGSLMIGNPVGTWRHLCSRAPAKTSDAHDTASKETSAVLGQSLQLRNTAPSVSYAAPFAVSPRRKAALGLFSGTTVP